VSSDDAVRNAIPKASKTVRGTRWFEVTDTRGHTGGDAVAHWQVTIKVGLALEDWALCVCAQRYLPAR
jgi:dodecin